MSSNILACLTKFLFEKDHGPIVQRLANFNRGLSNFFFNEKVYGSYTAYWVWLALSVRSLPTNHEVPGSSPGSAEIWIFLPKLTSAFHPSGIDKRVPASAGS